MREVIDCEVCGRQVLGENLVTDTGFRHKRCGSKEDNFYFISLPTKKPGESYPAGGSFISKRKDMYPLVDIKEELNEIRLYLHDNPDVKSELGYRDMQSFINGWLGGVQRERESG